MEIERYSHVMHIVSNVEGEISDDFSPLDALRACFPAGTSRGAPKVRAMEIIAELEVDRRGVYAGAVGYVSFSGAMDTCIALRTLVVKDGVASHAGGRRHRRSTARRTANTRRAPQDAGAGCGQSSWPSIEVGRRCGAEGSAHDSADRQLRFVHLQPLPVPRASLARRCTVRPQRQDHASMRSGRRSSSERIVISPGPCTPREAGISVAAHPRLAGRGPDPRRLPRTPGDRRGVRRRRSCARRW